MDEEAESGTLGAAIVDWYARHGRSLAFRASSEPWPVLVSEVMLQQTQVSRVEGAWRRFMAAFPTPPALASAAPADAIRAWAGLGYNRRALNLWRAANAMVERHGGEVPRSLDELRALPGVGEYTARAVAAISFRAPVAAVDTNVRRVVSRLIGDAEPPSSSGPSARRVQVIAESLVDFRRPDLWTHAMMDVGATICRPALPACGSCPLNGWCATVGVGPQGLRTARARGPSPVAFEQTSRWLRGRIVDRLREAPDGGWLRFDGPIGSHGPDAVQRALHALAADGLIDHDAGRARLAARAAGTALAGAGRQGAAA